MISPIVFSIYLIALFQFCVGETQSIRLYYQDLSTQDNFQWGTIEYEQQRGSAVFSQNVKGSIGGQYCLGTHDISNHECFAYVESGNKDILLYVDIHGDVTGLGITGASKKSPQVHVQRTEAAPTPNYSPAVSPQNAKKTVKPATEKVIKKKILKLTDDEGKVIETEVEEVVEVEIDDRSWIQKNWFFIVLPLVFFLLLGEEKK